DDPRDEVLSRVRDAIVDLPVAVSIEAVPGVDECLYLLVSQIGVSDHGVEALGPIEHLRDHVPWEAENVGDDGHRVLVGEAVHELDLIAGRDPVDKDVGGLLDPRRPRPECARGEGTHDETTMTTML